MTEEYYGEEYHGRHHRHHWKIVIGIVFLLVVFALVLPILGGPSLTGNIIRNTFSNESIPINAKLSVPNLDLKAESNRIELEGNSDSFLQVGNQISYLGDSKSSYLVLEDFNGKISLNPDKIFILNGKVKKVFVNGIPVLPNSGESMKLNLDGEFNIKSLGISNGVSISELIYSTSGEIRLNNGGYALTVDNEKVSIKNYNGDLSIGDNELRINGRIKELKVSGDSELSVNV